MVLMLKRFLNKSNQRFENSVLNSVITKYLLKFKDGHITKAPRYDWGGVPQVRKQEKLLRFFLE